MQPMGLVDVDKTKMAWIQGWQDDGTEKMHFFLEFWCPLCFDNTDDEKLVVYFAYQYRENVGTDKSRSVKNVSTPLSFWAKIFCMRGKRFETSKG